MSVKQPYYLQAQDPLKLFEQSLQPPVMQQQPLEKKMKPFPMEPYNQNPSDVKVPEYYWDSSYAMTDNRVMTQQSNLDRRGKRQGVFRSEQDAVSRMNFEVKSMLHWGKLRLWYSWQLLEFSCFRNALWS